MMQELAGRFRGTGLQIFVIVKGCFSFRLFG